MSGCPVHHHGVSKARGCSHVAASSFSRLFPDLPGVEFSEEEAAILGGPGGLMHDYDGTSGDSDIPAGYIFFAQFIDHDITLDTTSNIRDSARDAKKVAELPNIRSVSLDLDCVYGFGPEGSPHIYDPTVPGAIAIHPNGHDLARSPGGTALIGDPRNDENIFVSQMQLMFHRFHNKLLKDRFPHFEDAQRETRYHYQWLVLFDLLKRLCDPEVYAFAAHQLLSGKKYPLCYGPDKCGKMTMPVEFSVAAYRVGHTMVRSHYAANADNQEIALFDERFGTLGFSALPEDLEVDWSYLLPVSKCIRPRSTLRDPVGKEAASSSRDMPGNIASNRSGRTSRRGYGDLAQGMHERQPPPSLRANLHVSAASSGLGLHSWKTRGSRRSAARRRRSARKEDSHLRGESFRSPPPQGSVDRDAAPRARRRSQVRAPERSSRDSTSDPRRTWPSVRVGALLRVRIACRRRREGRRQWQPRVHRRGTRGKPGEHVRVLRRGSPPDAPLSHRQARRRPGPKLPPGILHRGLAGSGDKALPREMAGNWSASD